MPSVMERSGAGVLSRSRAKNVTNGNSQPHSEEESSEDEHAHGRQRAHNCVELAGSSMCPLALCFSSSFFFHPLFMSGCLLRSLISLFISFLSFRLKPPSPFRSPSFLSRRPKGNANVSSSYWSSLLCFYLNIFPHGYLWSPNRPSPPPPPRPKKICS